MPVVLIGTNEFFSYATLDEADEYLSAHMRSADWTAAAEPVRAAALITMTRILDRQCWHGTRAVEDQDGAFPRLGLYYDGVAVSEADIPLQLAHATIEGALLLVLGEEIETVQNTSQKVASLSAGSVSISYFRGAEGLAQRFPPVIMELIGQWLCSGKSGFTNIYAAGYDSESEFPLGRGRSRGF